MGMTRGEVPGAACRLPERRAGSGGSGVELAGEVFQAAVDLRGDHSVAGARDLGWTILRPGGLTDAPATGKIQLAPPPLPRGTVPRADVAATIAALLDEPGTGHKTLELTSGDTPIAAAVHNIC
jgi:NAD(P)H-binding